MQSKRGAGAVAVTKFCVNLKLKMLHKPREEMAVPARTFMEGLKWPKTPGRWVGSGQWVRVWALSGGA